MLVVTEAAGAHLAQLLKHQQAPDDVAARFVSKGQGIALERDSQRPGDSTIEHAGRTVLLLDAQVSELLAEGTLDLQGEKLMLRHPKDSK